MRLLRSADRGDRSRLLGQRLGLSAALLLAGYFGFQGARIALLPADHVASWNVVIDDGFYYLQLARNIARGHGSTFDRVNPTNGYQPLWAWMLVPIFWCTDSAQLGLTLGMLLATCCGVLAMLLLYLALLRLAGLVPALLTTALIATHPYFVQLLLGGLETPALFVCLAATALFWAHRGRAVLAGDGPSARALGLLVGLSVLARVDVALVLAPLGLVLLLWRAPSWRARLRRTLWTGALATLLVGPYVGWNLLAHGHLVPVSGRVKAWVVKTYQGSEALFDTTEQWRGLARTTNLLSFPHHAFGGENREDIAPALAFSAALLLLLLLRHAWRTPSTRVDHRAALLLPLGAGVAAHSAYLYFVYRSCSHWNYHYFFPYALAHAIALASVTGLFSGDLAKGFARVVPAGPALLRYRSAAALLAAFGLASWPLVRGWREARDHYRSLERPPQLSFRHARYEMADLMARSFPRETVFGAWWAGNLGYFSDRRVVNLDGVINSNTFLDRVLKREALPRYLEQGPVTHLVDYFYRDPLARYFTPSSRAFWWEFEKEHVVKQLQRRLRRLQLVRFQGASGMYLMQIDKRPILPALKPLPVLTARPFAPRKPPSARSRLLPILRAKPGPTAAKSRPRPRRTAPAPSTR